ncbi:aminotransferase class IV family protein [Streptomyces sp. Ac-502]|uniref:aminotransferase class IV family protein n=1 Tax=Streptomyces sp. Ac-502 TaxID=3342801 RepID=UPI0038625AF7
MTSAVECQTGAMAYLNGAPATLNDLQALALVPYGHFTSMRADDQHRIRGLSLHLERLQRDCRAVFDADLDVDRVRAYARQVLDEQDGPCVVRVTVYDPALELGHPGADAHPSVLVTVRSAGAMPPPAMAVSSVPFSRDSAEVKHVALFGQLKARRQAQRNGYDDALFIEADGRVSEGGTWNIGFVAEDRTVVWPKAPVLPGVTMRLLQDMYSQTITEPVMVGDLPQLRAAFATNTSIGVRPISRIDETEFRVDDPVISDLQQHYAELPGQVL